MISPARRRRLCCCRDRCDGCEIWGISVCAPLLPVASAVELDTRRIGRVVVRVELGVFQPVLGVRSALAVLLRFAFFLDSSTAPPASPPCVSIVFKLPDRRFNAGSAPALLAPPLSFPAPPLPTDVSKRLALLLLRSSARRVGGNALELPLAFVAITRRLVPQRRPLEKRRLREEAPGHGQTSKTQTKQQNAKLWANLRASDEIRVRGARSVCSASQNSHILHVNCHKTPPPPMIMTRFQITTARRVRSPPLCRTCCKFARHIYRQSTHAARTNTYI